MTTIVTDEYLTDLKTAIEKLNRNQQLEILHILKKNPSIKLNENRGGIFLNMSFVPVDVLETLKKYVEFIQDQEKALNVDEQQKQKFKNTLFSGGIAIGELS